MPGSSKAPRDPLWSVVAWTWLASIVAASTLLSPWFWLSDLFANFRVYYFAFFTPAAVLLFWFKRYPPASFALIFGILNLCFLLPYWGCIPVQAPSGQPGLKVASINVLFSNPQKQKVIDEILRRNPDIIFLMEINDEWKAKLAPLQSGWPYTLAYPQVDDFGVMFLSKFPLTSGRCQIMGEPDIRSLEANFVWQGRLVTILGLHPFPPVRAEGTRIRNEQLACAAEEFSKKRENVVVVGDFNATPWSEAFIGFLKKTGLRDAALGFGIHATWERAIVRVPIDHICVDRNVAVRSFHVGSDIGSDHLPIFAELVFKE